MSKHNITKYGSGELSLHFFNDESLYHAMGRAYDCAGLRRLANMSFTYTEEQFEELCEDWEADQAEMYG